VAVRVTMMVVARVGRHLADRHHAAMDHFTVGVFKLDRCVVDVKFLFRHGIDLEQDAVALRRRNVVDLSHGRPGVGLRAQAPDMQVVHIDYALHLFHASANLLSDMPRGVPSSRIFSVSRTMSTELHRISAAMTMREHRIDPVLPGKQNARAAGDHRSGRKRVPGHVDEGAAHVDVARHAPQQRGDDAIHHHACRGDPHHQPRLDDHRSAQAMDCLDADPKRDQYQRGGIQKTPPERRRAGSRRFCGWSAGVSGNRPRRKRAPAPENPTCCARLRRAAPANARAVRPPESAPHRAASPPWKSTRPGSSSRGPLVRREHAYPKSMRVFKKRAKSAKNSSESTEARFESPDAGAAMLPPDRVWARPGSTSPAALAQIRSSARPPGCCSPECPAGSGSSRACPP
jgi:hypothetical protein